MKQYLTFLKISIIKGIQYKIAAIAGIFTQFFFGLLFIMIFEAYYAYSTKTQPIELNQLIQMIWLQQSFLVFIMLWYRDSELYEMITSGNIAYELCRPTNLYHYWYSRLLGQRLAGALLRCIPIIILASLVPEPYTLHLPADVTTLLLFIITLIGALLLIVALSMLIYISIFYTLSPAGSFLMIAVIGEFFAGLTIPVPLMPKGLQVLCYILPFRYTADLPFRIYSGNISASEGIIGFGVQLLWLILLLVGGQLWMKKAISRVVVQGG